MGFPVSDVQSSRLPIDAFRNQIISTLANSDVLVLCGETGSGKTTQLPQFIYQSRQRFARDYQNRFSIAITQPRRIAATSVAKRVSEEMSCSLGGLVGYQVRFDDCSSKDTRIKYLTDGMLVREAILDPEFSHYGVVIVDEAHERSLHTDVILGLLCRALQKHNVSSTDQKRLRVVVMSATLNVLDFSNFFKQNTFSGCSVNVLNIPGRSFPVSTWYVSQKEVDIIESTTLCVVQLHVKLSMEEGLEDGRGFKNDMLVFLPGQEEIEAVRESLEMKNEILRKKFPGFKRLAIKRFYAALPQEEQLQVFNRSEQLLSSERVVVLATNIAETSVTIPNIGIVVDCGLVKQKSVGCGGQWEVLQTVEISRSAAMQRAGRAGRVGPGNCFRLYTETDFEKLREETTPEILRTDLTGSIIQLRAIGIKERICDLPFLDKPKNELVDKAEDLLVKLEAIITGELTSLTVVGKDLACLPVHPLLGKTLIVAKRKGDYHLLHKMASFVSISSTDNIWVGGGAGGDSGRRRSSTSNKLSDVVKPHAECAGDHEYLVQILEWFMKETQGNPKCGKGMGHLFQAFCAGLGLNYNSLKKAISIRKQLVHLLKIDMAGGMQEGDPAVWTEFRKVLVESMWTNLACRQPAEGNEIVEYKTLDKVKCFIHPSSILFRKTTAATFIFTELVQTKKMYMRYVTAIEDKWLPELVPKFFNRVEPTS